MKKIAIVIVLVTLILSVSKAQKYDISYGPVLGLNTSFMNSKASIDYNYPFNELDRNIVFNKSGKIGFGYQIGIYFKIQPKENRLNLESNILVVSYNNSYSISVYYESYYRTPWRIPVDNWIPETETESLQNEFSIITIPLILGYDIVQSDNYNIMLLCGLSPNITMKNNQVNVGVNFNENHLYKDFFLSYQTGIKFRFNKINCMLKYESSLNFQETKSRDYFPLEMKVEKLYLNIFSISVGYNLK